MQSNSAEGNEGASAGDRGTVHGLLEDPERVRDEHDLDVIIPVYGHTATLVGRTWQPEVKYWGTSLGERPELRSTDALDLAWMIRRYQGLNWTHRGALLILEGASYQQLLGPLVLLGFKARPVHSVRPGCTDVEVAVVEKNGRNLAHKELFFAIVEAMMRGPDAVSATFETSPTKSPTGDVLY